MASSPTADVATLRDSPAGFALRSGSAAAICLVIAESFHLPHANLAVWTTHMVMSQYEFTSFQKGIERILGRGVGILTALVLLMFFRNSVYIGFVFECVALMVIFYIHFSKRLAYTFLNAGLYLAVIMEIGRIAPRAALPAGGQMFLAVIVGVVVADLVSWFGGVERDLAIRTTGEPFTPIDRKRVGQCLALVATIIMSQALIAYFALPASTTLVSVMVLTIAPDLHQLVRKGELRVLGAFLAMAYAFCSLMLLVRLQHFPLLVVLMFLGSYLASYLARTGGSWAYAGVQMGLVLPMILIVPADEFGTMTAAVVRLEGVAIALSSALVVGGVVALFSRREATTANP